MPPKSIHIDGWIDPGTDARSDPVFGRDVQILAGSFAIALFVVASIVWGLAGFDPIKSAPGKMIGIAGDAVLAAFITFVLWCVRSWPLGAKAILACTLSLALAPLSGLLDWAVHICFVSPKPVPFDPQYFAQVVIFTTSELFGWSCLYLALQYNAEVRRTERRLAQLREEALTAQMRALHYQVNPHFLFNTLNSVAGLVEEGQTRPARDMILQLAAFLRRTLALDVLSETRLAEEISLQLEYLAIEKTRFSDRMTVALEISAEAGEALVPSLILQPLVENAVKHGVARTPGMTSIHIGAEKIEGEILRIRIDNSVPEPASRESGGMGIGLSNVAARLATRFGDAGYSAETISTPGRMRVEIRMPYLS